MQERNSYSPEMMMRVKEGTPPNLINLAEESRSSETIENLGLDDDRYASHIDTLDYILILCPN